MTNEPHQNEGTTKDMGEIQQTDESRTHDTYKNEEQIAIPSTRSPYFEASDEGAGEEDAREGYASERYTTGGHSSDSDSETPSNHACTCGNPGHINLSEWRHTAPGTIEYSGPLKNDSLDIDLISRELEDMKTHVKSSGGLCTSCQDFRNALPTILCEKSVDRDMILRPHFRSTAESQLSYEAGCRLCTMLRQADTWEESWSGSFSLESCYKIEARLRCLGKPIAIGMVINKTGSEKGCVARICLNVLDKFCISTFTTSDSLEIHAAGVLVPSDTSYTEMLPTRLLYTQLEVVRKWIAECTTSHNSCVAKSIDKLPTRLLAIHSNTIKVILTAALDNKPKYATLSHCWGTLDFLKLTTESLGSLMDSIQPKELTKTFLDAISIARSLNIDYIWIDSLCIIQDSKTDWEIESASMATVYRGSTVTIAATGAADGRGGCFLGPRTQVGRVCVQETSNGCTKAWDITNQCALVHELPLGQRAWTLQERLLSPRVVHFTPKTILWECRSGSASELSPKIVRSQGPEHSLSTRWCEIVGEYTLANLTYGKDKLVAIAGIARAANEENSQEYLAGLWREDLEAQLLWYRDGEKGCRPPLSEPYRAPSWSWASMDGAIGMDSTLGSQNRHQKADYLTCAHVLSSSLSHSGIDPYVQISHGILELCFKTILSGKLQRITGKGWTVVSSQGAKILASGKLRLDSDEDDGSTVFVLPIYDSGPPSTERKDTGRCLEGLLLRRSSTEKGEYRRVGTWCLLDERDIWEELTEWGRSGERTSHDVSVAALLAPLEEFGLQTAESACARILSEPKYVDEKYVITLI